MGNYKGSSCFIYYMNSTIFIIGDDGEMEEQEGLLTLPLEFLEKLWSSRAERLDRFNQLIKSGVYIPPFILKKAQEMVEEVEIEMSRRGFCVDISSLLQQ